MGLLNLIHSYLSDCASDIEFIREEHPLTRTREYFRAHSLNDGFDLSANNLDHYLQTQHASNWVQGLAGSVLSAGQLLWGIPVGLKDMAGVANEASQRSVKFRGLPIEIIPFGRTSYVLGSVGSFMIHGVLQGVGMVGGSLVNWSHGSLTHQNSFQIAREVSLTAGVAGMLLKGGEDSIRGGGNFLNAACSVFQNAGELSFSPAAASALASKVAVALPASRLPELGVGVYMMSAHRPEAGNTSQNNNRRPDQDLVDLPKQEFIQGSELPDISFPEEAPLRRVILSPIRVLRSAVTNILWERYVTIYGRTPWAIIGRISEENANVNERGRWGVLRRGSSQAELQEYLASITSMEGEGISPLERELGRRQVDDGRRLFDVKTLQIHEVITEDALEHPEGFGHPDQPVVGHIDWPTAVAAADGMGRLLTKGTVEARTAEFSVRTAVERIYGRRAAAPEDFSQGLAEANPGYLLTEAEWEAAARGPLERITVSPSDFPAYVRGPQINGRDFQVFIPRRENFVEIVNPHTLEFGAEVFTDPNHPMVQAWLRNGVLGAWNVFAGDLEQGIYSSVFEQRRATRSVLEEPGNTFGLRGMSGNTYEWVNDYYGNYEAFATLGEAIQNPRGPGLRDTRVFRGGSWDSDFPGPLRAAYRHNYVPSNRSLGIALRICLLP